MTSFSGWLEQIGLAHHGPVLTENGIDFDVVPSLTEDDLRSVGLNLGDRRRLLQATARLGEQAGAPHTDPAGAAHTASKPIDIAPGEHRCHKKRGPRGPRKSEERREEVPPAEWRDSAKEITGSGLHKCIKMFSQSVDRFVGTVRKLLQVGNQMA